MLLNKIDLLPHLEYDVQATLSSVAQIHPGMPVFQISAKTGEGFEAWLSWLRTQVAEKQKRP